MNPEENQEAEVVTPADAAEAAHSVDPAAEAMPESDDAPVPEPEEVV
jgi:hypothetical protein